MHTDAGQPDLVTQIIAEADLGKGHERFGITQSALEAWIASLA